MTAQTQDASSYWVFGYGSLIWRPGFVYRQAQQALLWGAHRSLCIYSHRYRGTEEKPGLVFGLVPGGSCHGMAFEVGAAEWPEVREYLREREQVSGVYREASRRVRLASGEVIEALTFLVDPHHEQYAGRLDIAAQLAYVRDAAGMMGPNADYVTNTAEHLEQMGIRDRHLLALSALLAEPAKTEPM